MQASLSNLIAKSQCAPAGNGRCYFVPEKTVSDVKTVGSGNTNHRFQMWKAEVMRSETTGFACGKHSLSFRMWRQHRGTSFRLWKREGQPRGTDESIRIGKRKREPSPRAAPCEKPKSKTTQTAAPEPPQAKRAAKAPACKIEHPGTGH